MTDGYNYVQNVPINQNMHQWLTRFDINVSNNTRLFARYNLQAEEQNFPVGLWWRNAAQVPYPTEVTAPNRSHSATLSLTKIFGILAHDRVDVRDDLHRFPQSVPRSEPGLAVRARLHERRDLRKRPGSDPLDDGVGERTDALQPGRIRSGAVRQEMAGLRRAERHEGRRRAHDEGGRVSTNG